MEDREMTEREMSPKLKRKVRQGVDKMRHTFTPVDVAAAAGVTPYIALAYMENLRKSSRGAKLVLVSGATDAAQSVWRHGNGYYIHFSEVLDEVAKAVESMDSEFTTSDVANDLGIPTCSVSTALRRLCRIGNVTVTRKVENRNIYVRCGAVAPVRSQAKPAPEDQPPTEAPPETPIALEAAKRLDTDTAIGAVAVSAVEKWEECMARARECQAQADRHFAKAREWRTVIEAMSDWTNRNGDDR
jgi:hypothetical protein